MATIDVGPGATDRSSTRGPGSTYVDLNNPANDTGVLDTVKVWAYSNLTGFLCGVFSGSSGTFACTDYADIGSVASGSEQPFTGLTIDVSSGQYLGAYWGGTGAIENATSGFSGVYYKMSSPMSTGEQTGYTLYSGDAISIYATGATVAAGSLLTSLFRKPFRHMLIR